MKKQTKKNLPKSNLGLRQRLRAKPALESAESPRALQYKVVELSTVDEGNLERTINNFVAMGWSLDCVQFAMRESSKRPAMAFVIFTKEGAPAEAGRAVEEARSTLQRLSDLRAEMDAAPQSAWDRLRELAFEPDHDHLEEDRLRGS